MDTWYEQYLSSIDRLAFGLREALYLFVTKQCGGCIGQVIESLPLGFGGPSILASGFREVIESWVLHASTD